MRLRFRALAPLAGLCLPVALAGLAACELTPGTDLIPAGGTGGTGGASTFPGGPGGSPTEVSTGGEFNGFGGLGGSGPSGGACDPSNTDVRAHVIDVWMPLDRVFYAWTSPEGEEALRDGGELLPANEPGQVWTHSVDQLAAWALGHPEGIEAAVMPSFETWRSVWPHPWPVRLGIEGEDTGSSLVRMELADDAWIARVAEHGAIWQIFDLQGNEIGLDVARATPERVALLYYIYLGEDGSEQCGPVDRQVSGTGYRQFILGSPSMIRSYEVGTERILSELEWNIAALYGYFNTTRPCPPQISQPFEATVICNWGYHADPYLDSLASASEAFSPTPMHLADLIDRLEDSVFELDPFVVQQPTNE